jgi:glucose-6-phosphate isomerase
LRPLSHNCATISAALIAYHYNHGKFIHDTFLFSVALTSLGAWYRQLSAESIGKSHDRNNALVNISLLPTISIGSTDLHSVAQLYFAGAHNRFTTFISVEKNQTYVEIPAFEEFERVVPSLQNKSLATIMDAILQGTKKAYQQDKLPFVSFNIPEKSAFYIGQFMQIKMIEIMYLGYLLNINPFDQPEIEKYKKNTREILLTSAT